ncbi:hypothetical protein CDD83_1681 [Cordyceps sp. RAO-2017]|nr:hypothetical protein CDD83_1681 [Cordyceps sp. RAO-2017]
MSAPAPEYQLVYWPGLPGRGELIRLLFEEACVRYDDTAKRPTEEAVGAVRAHISPDKAGDDDKNPPVLAPPILKHGRLVLGQTSNILLYLAPRLGLGPDASDPLATHRLHGIVLSLLDGFVDEVHETHHPVAVAAYYEDQKPEAARRARAYRQERLPKFLGYVQRVLEANAGDAPWLFGGQLTYADLVLFQGIDGVLYAFPKAMHALRASAKYDAVFALYDAVKARPNIKAYLASDRRAPYADGIWRHYPELDDD